MLFFLLCFVGVSGLFGFASTKYESFFSSYGNWGGQKTTFNTCSIVWGTQLALLDSSCLISNLRSSLPREDTKLSCEDLWRKLTDIRLFRRAAIDDCIQSKGQELGTLDGALEREKVARRDLLRSEISFLKSEKMYEDILLKVRNSANVNYYCYFNFNLFCLSLVFVSEVWWLMSWYLYYTSKRTELKQTELTIRFLIWYRIQILKIVIFADILLFFQFFGFGLFVMWCRFLVLKEMM